MGKTPLGLGRRWPQRSPRGAALYRFDRCGVGDTSRDWWATGFFQHRQDAAAVLRALAARPEVSTVGAIGYFKDAI